MKWIILQEQLPPLHEYVLIWVPSRPWVSKSPTVFAKVACRYPDGRWKEFGPGSFNDVEVTHWARIQPPVDNTIRVGADIGPCIHGVSYLGFCSECAGEAK